MPRREGGKVALRRPKVAVVEGLSLEEDSGGRESEGRGRRREDKERGSGSGGGSATACFSSPARRGPEGGRKFGLWCWYGETL
jgi:hypothetical protein